MLYSLLIVGVEKMEEDAKNLAYIALKEVGHHNVVETAVAEVQENHSLSSVHEFDDDLVIEVVGMVSLVDDAVMVILKILIESIVGLLDTNFRVINNQQNC